MDELLSFEALSNNPLFQGMEFSDDPEKLMEWIPLMMKERTSNEPIAATKIDSGTDVNFGALTRLLFDHLKSKNVDIKFKHQVDDIKRTRDGSWALKVRNIDSGTVERRMSGHKSIFSSFFFSISGKGEGPAFSPDSEKKIAALTVANL